MTEHYRLRPEDKFLIGLSRLGFDALTIEKLTEQAAGISDWNHFVLSANNHGISALAGSNIEKHGLAPLVPPGIMAVLRNSLMLSISRNTYLFHVLGTALKILEKEKIMCVLLKGAALEASVYNNNGLRQMTDTDLLIRKEECFRAWQILKKNGFKSQPVKSPFHRLILQYIGKHLPPLIRDGVSVELHHDLFGKENNNLTGQFSATCNVTYLGDIKTFIPEPQIFFLYLVRHLHYHEQNNESQLRLYTDLVVLLEKHSNEIINYSLTELAEKAGLQEVLADRLMILREVWDIKFPSFIDDFILEYHREGFRESFSGFVLSPKNKKPGIDALKYYQIFREIPGLHRKVLYLLGDLFPSIRFMKKRYSCSTFLSALFYYPHRFGKIILLIKGSARNY